MLQTPKDWQAQLAKEIAERSEQIRFAWGESHKRWTEIRNDPLLRRKSRAVTAFQEFLIAVVSNLYGLETRIRAWLHRQFHSEYLRIYHEMTNEAQHIIERTIGEIPVETGLPVSQADGTGGLTVAMILTHEKREVLEALLPNGMELIPGDNLPEKPPGPGLHPLMIGLGLNTGARPVQRNRHFRGMNYLEMTIGIPMVQLAPEFGPPRGPFFYLPGLYLNFLTPTLLGWAFGFKKRLRRIASTSSTFRVSSLLRGREKLNAEVTNDQRVQFAWQIRELRPWLAHLEQPIISRAWWGKFRCTHFHWDWYLTRVSAASISLKARDEFAGVIGSQRQFSAQARGGAEQLAYVMSVPWRLLLPFDRKVLRRASVIKFILRRSKRRVQTPAATSAVT